MRGRRSDALAQLGLCVKKAEQFCERRGVQRVAQDEAIDSIVKKIRYSGKDRSDYRESACHGLRDGQGEGVFAARTNVQIGGGVEIEYCASGRFPKATRGQTEAFRQFLKRLGSVAADNQEMDRQISRRGHGVKDGWQAFYLPIVADEQQQEVAWLQMAVQAGFRAPSRSHRGRKLRGVDAIRNDVGVISVKKTRQLTSRAAGDRCQNDTRVRIDTAFETGEQPVVDAAMHTAEGAGGKGHGAALLACELAQAVKNCVDDDYVGIGTVNARREDNVKRGPGKECESPAPHAIEEIPRCKVEEQRSAQSRNAMPEDGASARGMIAIPRRHRKIFYALREEMDLAAIVAGQAFDQFGKRALRAMPAIEE